MKTPFAILLITLGVAQAQSYSFARFDVPGASWTTATAINNSGQILGVYSDSTNTSHCFLRSPDGATYTTLADPPEALPGSTRCNGINNLGQIAGSFQDATGRHCFIRSAAGEFTVFDPVGGTGPGPDALAINDGGEVVGIFASPPNGGACYLRHPDGSFTILGAGLGSVVPMAINNQDEIAGWVLSGSSQAPQHGFFRSSDGVFRIFDLPGTGTNNRVYAMNNLGQFAGIVVGTAGFISSSDGSFTVVSQYQWNGINDGGLVVGTLNEFNTVQNKYLQHGAIAVPGPLPTQPVIRTAVPGVIAASAFGGIYTHIAPGSWIEIYGQDLAPKTRSWRTSDFNGEIAPTALDGVSVSINGVPAYVSYISPGQVNALVPSNVAPGTAQVTVTNGQQTSAAVPVEIQSTAPGMLMVPQSSYAAAVFPDFTTYVLPPTFGNVPTQRAKAGDTIVLFGEGFGPVSPDVPVGHIAAQPGRTTASVTIDFSAGGTITPGTILYAGVVPGTVGLYQFNVVVPDIPFPDGQSSFDAAISVYVDRGPRLGPPTITIPLAK